VILPEEIPAMRRVSTLALAFVVCLCLVARAADALSGTWNATANSPQGAVAFTLTISVAESAVTGTVSSDMGTQTISDGKFDGETLSFGTTYNGMAVVMRARLADDKLSGTFSVDGGDAAGDWEASRAK
jgi:hypothetical protein